MEIKICRSVEEAIVLARERYPASFDNLRSCYFKSKHDWQANSSSRPGDIRLADVECRCCGLKLGIALGLFAGAGFH